MTQDDCLEYLVTVSGNISLLECHFGVKFFLHFVLKSLNLRNQHKMSNHYNLISVR